MKTIQSLLLVVFMLLHTSTIKAQYYVKSRKNKALLIANSYSSNQTNSILVNSVEVGRKIQRLFFHGGLSVFNNITSNRLANTEIYDNYKRPTYNGTLGFDFAVFMHPILDFSHKSFCKYLMGYLNVGFDSFKNLNATSSSDIGYRAKVYLSFSMLRGGSHKKDIGYRRYIEIGYCYSDYNIKSKYQTMPYHAIMLNVLIVKQRLIKFADWY